MGGQASYIKTTNAPVLVYYSAPGASGDYLSTSNNLAARTFFSGSGLSQRVVSYWVRGAEDGDVLFIGNNGDTTPSILLYMELTGGTVEITVTNDSGGAAYNGDATVTGPDIWHHVFFYTVSDGGSDPGGYLFIDGQSQDYFDSVADTFATARDDFHFFNNSWLDADVANIAVFPMGSIYSEHLGANGRAYALALYEAGPQHDVRQPYRAWPGKTPSFYWRDQGIVNASSKIIIPNRGTGGACDLVLNGNCSVVAF